MLHYTRYTKLQVQRAIDSYEFISLVTPNQLGYEISFNVKSSNKSETDESTIVLKGWNQTLLAGTYVRLTSGYRNPSTGQTDVSVIFVGEVLESSDRIESGTRVQELRCVDVSYQLLQQKVNFNVKSTTISTLVAYLIRKFTNSTVAVGHISRTYDVIPATGETLKLSDDETIWEHLQDVAEEFNANLYAKLGRIYFVDPAYYIPESYILNPRNGLLTRYNSPDEEDPGAVTFEAVFLPHIAPNGLLGVNRGFSNRTYDLFAVIEMEHKASATEYKTVMRCLAVKQDVTVPQELVGV